MSNITVTVNGQSGPSITATTGDVIGVSVDASSSSYAINVTQAGTPGGIGPQGPAGPAYTTVAVGNTTTLTAGSNATVTSTSSNSGANLTLNFGIPAGATGPQGPAGQNGVNGVTPSFSIGNVTTLSAGSSANVTLSTANNGANVTLNFGIPQGAAGSGGNSGSSEWSSLLNVPANFPTNTTLVSGLAAGYSAINHAHNYVTGLNNLTGNLTLAAGSNVSISANGSTLTISAAGGGGGLGASDAINGGLFTGQAIVVNGTSGNGTASSKWTIVGDFLQSQNFVAPQNGTLYVQYAYTVNNNGGVFQGLSTFRNGVNLFNMWSGDIGPTSGSGNSSVYGSLSVNDVVRVERTYWTGTYGSSATALDYAGNVSVSNVTLWIA